MENPNIPASAAHLFWHEDVDPAILTVIANPRQGDHSGFDLRSFAAYATVLRDPASERICLSDGLCRIRLDVMSGTLLNGAVTLRFLLDDDSMAPARMREIMRLRAFRSRGRFARWLEAPIPQRTRWKNQLRALDAADDGATTREIAAALFPSRASADDWRDGGESLRSSIRRLVANARRMSETGYRTILSRA